MICKAGEESLGDLVGLGVVCRSLSDCSGL